MRRSLLSAAVFGERVGWPDQIVRPAGDMDASQRPYFSLLLVRQGWPDVLP